MQKLATKANIPIKIPDLQDLIDPKNMAEQLENSAISLDSSKTSEDMSDSEEDVIEICTPPSSPGCLIDDVPAQKSSRPQNPSSFYEKLYRKQEGHFPYKLIQKKFLKDTQTGYFDPVIYQAMAAGQVLIQGGGVFDTSNTQIHPIKIFEKIRKIVYSMIFPYNEFEHDTFDQPDIKIYEIYNFHGKFEQIVAFSPTNSFDFCRRRLMSDYTSGRSDVRPFEFLEYLNKELALNLENKFEYVRNYDEINWGLPLILKYLLDFLG